MFDNRLDFFVIFTLKLALPFKLFQTITFEVFQALPFKLFQTITFEVFQALPFKLFQTITFEVFQALRALHDFCIETIAGCKVLCVIYAQKHLVVNRWFV